MDFLGIFADRLPPAISQYDAAFVFLHFKKHLEVHSQERRTFLRYKTMFFGSIPADEVLRKANLS
jgi:hypothetical protein